MKARVVGLIQGQLRRLRASSAASPLALGEQIRERVRPHLVDSDHAPHRDEALAWLERAQDATPDDGLSRGYCLTWNPHFGLRGWQPSYPETTGYIIPTFYHAGRALLRPRLTERATLAARWEITVQLSTGAVRGGVIGEAESPAVFNTGQVILGWLAALDETGDEAFAEAITRAADYLVSVQEADGHWRKGNSEFAQAKSTLYNARVSWALAEAGARLGVGRYRDAAARNLRAVAGLQKPNGWFPHCCLTDPTRPLLHTLAYTVRGLLEGGRVLGDSCLLEAAVLTSERLAQLVRSDGWMAGRFSSDWSPAVRWSCLTGQAQMANNWMQLYSITGERKWLEPVPRVLQFLKRTQNRSSTDPGLRGGIKGSSPVDGGYGRYEILNWATKYFVDALMRHDQVLTGRDPSNSPGCSSDFLR
jgi:uncharacterized protein YyaL (SSP411 family)